MIKEGLRAEINLEDNKSDHVHVSIIYLLADFLMIFILLRSLNTPGEEGETEAR